MPPRKKKNTAAQDAAVSDYRYDAKRKNNPPAGLAPQARVRETPRVRYAYDPHLPPVLRFDETGESDRAGELLAKAQVEPLTAEEAKELRELLRNREPWLEWTGKREAKGFEVDPVALHIHERVSTQAILKAVKREDTQKDLFADPDLPLAEAVQFYRHDVDWSNRLILGDSLQVMASLSKREDIAGKVQMIYMDPPYGIKFASNFQPEVHRRDVKDREQDLTREPEMVKAYRDTWMLGIHSYLGYLRDRLVLCRELLKDSGSVFVQISDENLHRVRSVLDEVFGPENFCSVITFAKTSGQTDNLLASVSDYLLWYARDRKQLKYHQLYHVKKRGGAGAKAYGKLELMSGELRSATKAERAGRDPLPDGARMFRLDNLTSQSPGSKYPVQFEGNSYQPKGYWKTDSLQMPRLLAAGRVASTGKNNLYYRRFIDDFAAFPLSDNWPDTVIAGFASEKRYVVETSAKVVERCVLMTTDPGDLVLDPTCGSGTTAFVSEHWGRRWITMDSSRVSVALARQRILTSTFPHFAVEGDCGDGGPANPVSGFLYKSVPHITLGGIARNVALDPILAKHSASLASALTSLNRALLRVTPEIRLKLQQKLAERTKRKGKKAISEADRRRWVLPESEWKEWEVPYDTDPDWPEALKKALDDYRAAWRAKMDEVNEEIARSADQEELVDQPEVVKGVTRVSGPFTVEAVMPAALSLNGPNFAGAPDEDLDTFDVATEPANAEAFLDRMIRYLRQDGVRFPDNKTARFARLDPVATGDVIHAEGEWESESGGDPRRVAVSFGPEHGPVTSSQVENALRAANRGGYDELVFAGFSFDGTAQAAIQEDPNPNVRVHMAHIAPDVQMGDLLKTQRDSQLFTVFGQPRSTLEPAGEGEWRVTMEGVDIYDPVENTILPTRADKVAAWFLDSDYDGRTFCITQAFFPDRKAWDKIARALKGSVDEEAFEALSGTESLPFKPGKHNRVAVKVIDPRGNEVMRVHRLGAVEY